MIVQVFGAKKRKLSVRFCRTVLSDEKDPVLIYFGVINSAVKTLRGGGEIGRLVAPQTILIKTC